VPLLSLSGRAATRSSDVDAPPNLWRGEVKDEESSAATGDEKRERKF